MKIFFAGQDRTRVLGEAYTKYAAAGNPRRTKSSGKKTILDGQLVTVKEDIMALSKELLDILACPKCKGDIYLNDTKDGLVCENCKLLYEIRDDIPIMLIDEAKSIDG
jgi:uncharacterized protein YbaR (Trm112 family)